MKPAPAPTTDNKVEVTLDTKLTAKVKSLAIVQDKESALTWEVVDALRTAREKHGYTHNQCTELLRMTYVELGYPVEANEPGTKYTYISKLHKLAFPVSEEAKKELEIAREEGIGINDSLRVARGKTTLEEITEERTKRQEEKKAAKANKPAQQGRHSTDGNKPSNKTDADKSEGKTINRRTCINAMEAAFDECIKFGLTTEDAVDELYNEVLDRYIHSKKLTRG